MRTVLLTITLRLALCGAVAWLLWHMLHGPLGLAFAAPFVGIALARPVIDLFGQAYVTTRRLALAPLEGRHFEHRGVPLDIAEDERHHRWVSVRDLRRLLRGLPRDASLKRQLPEGLMHDPRLRGLRIEAEALLAFLRRSTDPDSLKLRNWLEREVVFPAATQRRRLGIREEPPADDDGPAPEPAAGATQRDARAGEPK